VGTEKSVVVNFPSMVGQVGVDMQIMALFTKDNVSYNVECVSQSLRQTNMPFVIRREAFERAIVALNDALCVDRS
jgi:hypothetical protein